MAYHDVLLLNNNYEPLNVCTVLRAVTLLLKGKAEVLHHNGHVIYTGRGELRAPTVVRLRYHVKRPMPTLRMSRHSVLARDNHTCQYCGYQGKDLTIDHVVPRWMKGPHTWDNVVACCRKCNLKKGDKLPDQARMKLRTVPKRPHYIPYISLPNYMKAQGKDEWMIYLPRFEAFQRPD